MKRLAKYTLITGCSVISSFSPAKGQQLEKPVRKNVLFLMADDFNFWLHDIGYYPQARTPNLDKLAERGVLFTHANCSSPVCNPSRNALWSGLRPSTTGIETNHGGYVRDIPGFEDIVSMHEYFMQHGYFTFGAGKLWHPGHMGGHATDPTHWSELYTEKTGAAGGPYYKFVSDEGGLWKWSAGDYDLNEPGKANDTKMAKYVANLISTYSESEHSSQPFFIGCGVFRPHLPWNCPKRFYDLFDPDSLEIPAGYKENDLDNIKGAKPAKIHEEIVRKGKWKEGLRAYLANLAYADYNLGIILDALDKSPLKDNTIVVFMGDHGWHLGEKSRWSKYAVYTEANHTSLIVYDPSAEGNGKVCRKVVSLQDLYPTLVELTGLPKKTDIEGRSIVPLIENPQKKDWNWPIMMSYAGTNYIETNDWRYIASESSPQLYHISKDPYEWDNLVEKAQYKPVIDGLTAKMDSILKVSDKVKSQLKIGLNQEKPVKETPFILTPNIEEKQIQLDLTNFDMVVNLQIFDWNGHKILDKNVPGEQVVEVTLGPSLAKGKYLVHASDETEVRKENFNLN